MERCLTDPLGAAGGLLDDARTGAAMRHAREVRLHVRKMKHTFETQLIAINTVDKGVDR